MMDMFNNMDQSIRFLTEAIDQVHPPEDYDIFYHFDGKEDNKNLFDVMLRFRDVTISNSLEMDHYIGDLLVRTAGVQRLSMLRPEESFRIVMLGSLYGMRLSFSPGDAAMKYQHSHLTSGMESFGGFCTGSESYNTDGGGATQIDIQSHIMRIDQFIRWESLEGGPHMKIEGINIHGPERKIYNSSRN